MKEQLINFQTAKLAKEKGFNIKTKSWYDENFSTIEQSYIFFTNETVGLRVGEKCNQEKINYAPTQYLLQKWLREKHKIHVYIIPFSCSKPQEFEYAVFTLNKSYGEIKQIDSFLKYEEALEIGLQKALELI